MKVYFISGLGADKKAFQNIRLSPGYEPVFLDWITPEQNESLAHYADRFSELINKNEDFILIGLSFGGMVASEIAGKIKPLKTIIISSLATADELPWYFRRAGNMGLQNALPISFFKAATFLNRVVGAGSPEDKAVVYHFVKNADPAFVRWCLNAIINWKRSERLPGIIHLHGEKDHLLPLRYTKPDFVIKKGGHLMVLNRAKEVNEILNEILSKN